LTLKDLLKMVKKPCLPQRGFKVKRMPSPLLGTAEGKLSVITICTL
jgi:hypothetical protein